MPTFEEGDRVRVKSGTQNYFSNYALYFPNAVVGEEYTLSEYRTCGGSGERFWLFAPDNSVWAFEDQLELISKKNAMENVMEKFEMTFKKEPMRSFRKAGITNGSDILTDDGAKIFLSWLLQKHGEDFKKDVIEELLEKTEKSK